MRIGPPSADSGAMSRCRKQGINPLYAPPHPQKSLYLTPISTPMGYQAIILAFTYLFASICRGAAGRPRWFCTELVWGIAERHSPRCLQDPRLQCLPSHVNPRRVIVLSVSAEVTASVAVIAIAIASVLRERVLAAAECSRENRVYGPIRGAHKEGRAVCSAPCSLCML